MTRLCASLAALLILAACGRSAPPQDGAPPAAADAQPAPGAGAEVALACEPSPRMALEGRASPYDSVAFRVGTVDAKICYGRPSSRGRTMLGGELVPFDRLWRTGANEPTILHVSGPVHIAGVEVPAGSYSLYTIPTSQEWTIIINRSTAQWGHESGYTAEVEAQEVGRGSAPSSRLEPHVETFTIRAQPAGQDRVDLLLEWEHTRVTIPVVAH
jgi:hypothetical protein